jgi:hypothetical protein
MKPVEQLVMFEFGRHRIKALDFAPFLERYAQDKLPENPRRLRAMMGSLMPCIHGYDNDPRELHCIPEVRRFVREFHTVWPHWLFFFCALPGASTIEVFTACCLDRFNVIQRNGAGVTFLDSDPAELTRFLMSDLPAYRTMCDRAEVFPELRRARLAEVFALFHLPVPTAARVSL